MIGKYHVIGDIGKGTYGTVVSAQDDTTWVAIKKIRIDSEQDAVFADREIAIMQMLRHPNVMALQDTIATPTRRYLVMELMATTLWDMLRKVKLNAETRIRMARELLSAVAACHAAGVMHRDVTTQNVLVASDGSIRLADFGFAIRVSRRGRARGECTARWYRAPEVLMELPDYGLKIDVWSAGVVIAEMCIGGPLFPGDSAIDMLMKIFRALGTPSLAACPILADFKQYPITPQWPARDILLSTSLPANDPMGPLLRRLIAINPSDRPTARCCSLMLLPAAAASTSK